MRSETSSQGNSEFLAEAQHLARIHHRNLVSLIGYCKDKKHLSLEYMDGGNLQDRLIVPVVVLQKKPPLHGNHEPVPKYIRPTPNPRFLIPKLHSSFLSHTATAAVATLRPLAVGRPSSAAPPPRPDLSSTAPAAPPFRFSGSSNVRLRLAPAPSRRAPLLRVRWRRRPRPGRGAEVAQGRAGGPHFVRRVHRPGPRPRSRGGARPSRWRRIEAIEEYQGGDPLQPWVDCIKWVQESFPAGGEFSGIVVTYEQCVRAFWARISGNCADAEVIFRFLEANQIGIFFATRSQRPHMLQAVNWIIAKIVVA